MEKKVVKNYFYNLSYQLLVILLPLITIPYVSRKLGADPLGSYSYTNSITQYFILFGAIGLNLYGQREIAYKQKDKEAYSKSFFEILLMRTGTLTVSIGVFLVMAFCYKKYTPLFLIQVIDLLATVLDISWLFQGLEDFKKIVLRNFAVKLTGVALIFLLVKKPADIYLYVLIYSATLFLGNLSMWFYLPGMVKKVPLRSLELKKHRKPALALFIPQISVSVYTLLDKTMIGLITGNDAEVAYYEQSQKIVKMALTVVTSLGTVMMPRIANIFAQKDYKKINEYMMQTFQFVFALGLPILCGLIGISKNMVPWFFGAGYDKVVPNMRIIAPIILFIGLSNVTGTQFLLPVNRQKEFTISVVAGSVVNFICNLFLITRFQSYGAAVATIIAECSVTGLQIYFVRKDFSWGRIAKSAVPYAVSSACMLAVLLVLERVLPSKMWATAVMIAAGMLVYGLFLVLLRAPVIQAVREKISKRK